MVFELFRGGAEGSLEVIEGLVQEMLSDNTQTFQYASDALFGHAEAEEVRKPLKKSDRQVNRGEREIRRELMVHAGVSGAADYPLMMVYMSIIKDIERIGDYSKNIWDLCVDGFVLAGAPDQQMWEDRITRTQDLIGMTATVFADRDRDKAAEILPQMDDWTSEFDAEIALLMTSDATAAFGVPRALLNRYLKRITAHLMNVMTSVVMPLDRLDYWDEDKADRE